MLKRVRGLVYLPQHLIKVVISDPRLPVILQRANAKLSPGAGRAVLARGMAFE